MPCASRGAGSKRIDVLKGETKMGKLSYEKRIKGGLDFEDKIGRGLLGVECSMKCSQCGDKGLLKIIISRKRPTAFVCINCERVHDFKGNPSFFKETKIPEYYSLSIVKTDSYRII